MCCCVASLTKLNVNPTNENQNTHFVCTYKTLSVRCFFIRRRRARARARMCVYVRYSSFFRDVVVVVLVVVVICVDANACFAWSVGWSVGCLVIITYWRGLVFRKTILCVNLKTSCVCLCAHALACALSYVCVYDGTAFIKVLCIFFSSWKWTHKKQYFARLSLCAAVSFMRSLTFYSFFSAKCMH